MDTTKRIEDEINTNITRGKMTAENIEEHVEDRLSEAIGQCGRWHVFICLIFAIPVKITALYTLMSITFLAPKTLFVCAERLKSSDILNSTCYGDCIYYNYSSLFDTTIVSEWDLICGRAWLANFTQTVCLTGVLIGSLVFGFISDRCGRRTGLLSAAMIHLIGSVIVPFSPDYWSFTVIRFFLGAASAGLMVNSYVIVVEVISPVKRELMATIYHLPAAVAQISLAWLAYYVRSWDRLMMVMAIPNLVYLLYLSPRVLPESPKWLISMGRLEEASVVMQRAAKCNKKPTSNMLEVAKAIESDSEATKTDDQPKVTFYDLLTLPSLRFKNFCSCLAWFIVGLSFYGGNQYIGQNSPNPFLAFTMLGFFQIPGITLSGYFAKVFGRRNNAIILFSISGVCNGLLALPDDYFYVKLVSGAVGNGCVTGAFTAMYMYTSELFPTVARNMAMGTSSTASRVGSMLSPFVAGLSVLAIWLPPAIFGFIPLVAVGICCCLPETKGAVMEDHVVDKR